MNQEQQLDRRRLLSWLLIGLAIFVCIQLIIVSYVFNGLGLDEVTIWEWVGVLIIPLALFAFGVWFTNLQAGALKRPQPSEHKTKRYRHTLAK